MTDSQEEQKMYNAGKTNTKANISEPHESFLVLQNWKPCTIFQSDYCAAHAEGREE